MFKFTLAKDLLFKLNPSMLISSKSAVFLMPSSSNSSFILLLGSFSTTESIRGKSIDLADLSWSIMNFYKLELDNI